MPKHLFEGQGGTSLIYGDGSNGSATVTSTASITGMPVAYENLTINNGAVLTVATTILVRGTLTLNGAIKGLAGNASGQTAGSQPTTYMGVHPSGGTGGNSGAVGGNAANINGMFGGFGGNGGASGEGQAGGSGGGFGPNGTLSSSYKSALAVNFGGNGVVHTLMLGTGGGGGGAGAGSIGGGGGSGCYGFTIVAKNVVIGAAGLFDSRGGNGGNASGTNAGGGGGGGGGPITLIYRNLSGTLVSNVAGGIGGSGIGTGAAGANGSAGVFKVFIDD